MRKRIEISAIGRATALNDAPKYIPKSKMMKYLYKYELPFIVDFLLRFRS